MRSLIHEIKIVSAGWQDAMQDLNPLNDFEGK